MSRPRTSEERTGRSTSLLPPFLSTLRAGRRPSDGIEAAVRRVFAPHLASPDDGRAWRRWMGTLLLLRPLGGVSGGNSVEILPDGDEAFRAMWAAIAGARREVLLNTYLLAPDSVGRRTLEELTGAARRGCSVFLLYDSFGSSGLRERDVRELVQAGGRVLAFSPVLSWKAPFLRLVRNHRKILVVDDEVGFCGGMNVSRDYAGPDLGNGRFRDAHVRVRGPCVRHLSGIVRSAFGEEPIPLPEADADVEGSLVQVLESNVRRHTRAIQKALRYTIMRAVRTCYLTSPYFVPPGRLVRDLQRAAERGVDVRILTAGVSDVPLVRLASHHLHGRLLRSGVRIYEMRESVLHAKTATVDGVYAAVGSFNLDYWSYRRNLEVTVTALDGELAEGLQKRFLEDVGLGVEVGLEDWSRRGFLSRVVQWLAYQVMRM